MKFLLPIGGIIDDSFAGILTSPGHKGVPAGIVAGLPWAADNQAFTQGFRAAVFFLWLIRMLPYRKTCIFVLPPDVVGNALATLDNFRWHAWKIMAMGYPVAFAAQDGQELFDFPPEFDALFIGGSTEWKLGGGAIECIKRAQALGKHIHIGRVNWWKRYAHFRALKGSEEFTCDGTRQRFEGIERTANDWRDYQGRSYNHALPLRYHCG